MTIQQKQKQLSAASESGTIQGISDGGCEDHDPKLYAYSLVASCKELQQLPPVQDSKVKLIESYHRDGFLLIEKAFPDRVDDLGRALDEFTNGKNTRFAKDYKEIVRQGVPPDFTSGTKIPWVQYEAGTVTSNDRHQLLEPSKVLEPTIANRVRKLMGFVGYSDVIDATVKDDRLLSLVAGLLDCDVDELELFQDMALLKPPRGREKPWHQDKAYFNIPLETKVVGCWIAIDEATCENGCLRMMRGGHTNGPMMHFSERDYQICDEDAPSLSKGDEIVAIELKPGGLVLFDGMLPHGTPTNISSSRRRALQYHWTKREAKRIGENDPGGRIEVFGGVANGASC